MQIIGVPRRRRIKNGLLEGHEGIDFVRCRICGDHRRVISRRHLSKHGTDRETYMDEYRLSPDQLCAKDFRRLISSRPGYYPHGKRDWIAAMASSRHNTAERLSFIIGGFSSPFRRPFADPTTCSASS
jgi:hypothetical protein